MKKLFSIVAALLLVISLTACTEDSQQKVTELETKITELETTITGLETTVTELEGQTFDKVVTLSVKMMDGTTSSSKLGINDGYKGTLYDLLNVSFDVTATVSQYGTFITGIEDLNPANGAYISFAKNGESSMVGVDEATIEDGDVFSFELVWWDTTEETVSNGINLFLENLAADYVNDTTIDYVVMAALSKLGLEENYVSDEEVQTYVDGLTLSTTNDYFKAIVILEAAGLDSTSLQETLNGMASPSGYGGTGYQLQAFNSNETTVDFSAFETLALEDYATNTPAASGIDSGAIGVLALSNYKETEGVNALITDWVTYIKDNQTEDGAIKDIDFGWGTNENGATLAQAVIGLVGAGVNPKGGDTTTEDMTKLNYNLIARLCDFQNVDGSFNWLMDQEEADLGFSTPQAFLALAVYYEYSNSFGTAVNAYDFK